MPYLLRAEPRPLPMDCRILQAGLELFVKHGYHNVSVHDIQKHAGISIGSIYKHFGGKEGIARALYDHLLEEMNLVVDSVVAKDLSAIEQCNSLIKLLFEYTESHPEIIAYVLHSKHTEYITDKPPICSSEPFQKMREIVKRGMEAGEIQSYDYWIATSVIFGAALRMINLRLDGLIRNPLPGYYDQLIEATWLSMKTPDIIDLPKLVSN